MRQLVLASLLLAAVACRRTETAATASAEPAVPVQAVVVRVEPLPSWVEVPATVRPAERASIAARLTGTIVTFPAGLGASVQAGVVLLTLKAPEAEARLRQAEAQLAEAERNAARQRTLVASGVNPSDALRDAEDRLRYAQAAAAEVEALLDYATVRAPFDGVITEKNVLPGDLATPGMPLLVLESTQRLRAEGRVPEKAAVSLRLGDSVDVLLDEATEPVTGTLEEISGAADIVSHSVFVKVALPAGVARSGQFARLLVKHGTVEAILVPKAAVSRFGQMERSFVIDGGRAVLRLVKTGRALNDQVEILAGLSPGERVIVAPPGPLRDGAAVDLRP